MNNLWVKKRKGSAVIHTHPCAFDDRAIVENSYGITFNGVKYASLEEAKVAARKAETPKGENDDT